MTEPYATQSTAPDHDQQRTPPTGPIGVVRMAGTWSPTDRWAWAFGLPVSAIARAVASCIAFHANVATGLAWPGFGRIVEETGFKRRAVILATQELERGGHLTVSRVRVGGKNKSNRYQLPPMGGSAPHALPSAPHALGGAPHALGGSAPHAPESVSSLESVKEEVSSSSDARAREATAENSGPERLICEVCGNDWPAKYGTTCYECSPSERRHAAQMKRNRESEKAPEEDLEELGKATKENEDPKPPRSAQEAVGTNTDRTDFTWKERLKATTKRSELDRRWKPDGRRRLNLPLRRTARALSPTTAVPGTTVRTRRGWKTPKPLSVTRVIRSQQRGSEPVTA